MEYTDKILKVAQTIVAGMECLQKKTTTPAAGLKTLDARDTAEEIQERVKAERRYLKSRHNANERDAAAARDAAEAAARAPRPAPRLPRAGSVAAAAAAAPPQPNPFDLFDEPPPPSSTPLVPTAPPPSTPLVPTAPPPPGAGGRAFGGRRIIPTVRLAAAHRKGGVAFPGTRRTVNKRTNTKRRSTYRR